MQIVASAVKPMNGRRAHALRYVCTLSVLFLIGCLEKQNTPEPSGELGTDRAELLQLAEWQPLGTVISSAPSQSVVTVLIDLWITEIPEGSEITTRTPDGIYSASLGESILERRRVHAFTTISGTPTPGDLVFYRKP